ncbi:MAG: aminotransferase class III-fold pyridoxal phosphate-dependent enzyme [Proteobacteria bacterium]|nr:aminotransferase class III-fold pyridoxal phosphate-dependent enzyme [Pseudomonadota bacterium]
MAQLGEATSPGAPRPASDARVVGRRGPVGEREREHLEAASRLFPGGAVAGYALPEGERFVVKRGAGAWLEDLSGNRYIDYVCGAGALILGHAHPKVTEAIASQAALGTHFFAGVSEPNVALARVLKEAIPCAERVVYATTGSEATFYAMRMARTYMGRSHILKFEGGYHGNHDYALQSTTPKARSNYPQSQPDTGGIVPGVGDSVLIAPYNDLEVTRRIVAEHRDEIAGIMVEPIQRSITPKPGFLRGLRTIADDFGVLLIFDEVVTGFRLAYGGAQEYFGVTPDLASYGKIMGGGLGLSAVAGRADVIDHSNPARKGDPSLAYVNGTIHGNPLAAAAGLATIEQLCAPGFYEALNAKGAAFRKEIAGVLRRHGMRASVMGDGSIWHVAFTDTVPTSYAEMIEADRARQTAFERLLIRKGIHIFPGVRRFVSAVHGDAEFEPTFRAFDEACRELG